MECVSVCVCVCQCAPAPAAGFITTGSGKILRAQCVPAALSLAALFYAQQEGHKGALNLPALAWVCAASVVTLGLSFFVKSRVAGDAAFHAKKNADK